MQVIKQSVERIPTPYEALHQDSYGTIEISHISSEGDTRWKGIRRRYHTLEKIKDEFVEKYDNENIYFSMNRFKGTSRRQENLLEITSLWSDIDYYKTDYTKEQVIGQIEIMIEDREIPRPTFIVDSGRGIYLIWKIQRVPKEALMRWKRIMEYFQEKLEYLGADARCIEPSRILRMNGSIHQGTKKVVSTIEYTGNIYTLHNLAKEFSYALPYSKPNVTTKTKRTKTYKPYYHNRNVLYLQNQYKVYQARIQDLSKLAELREYNVRGTRELMLFLVRYWEYCSSKDEDLAIKKMVALNERFKEPLEQKEVLVNTKVSDQAKRMKIYRYGNKKLIQLLKITEEEQMQLSSIHSEKIRSIKRAVEQKANRRNNEGLTSRQQAKQNTETKVITEHQMGYKTKEIAEKIGLSIRQVQRIIKKYKEESQES